MAMTPAPRQPVRNMKPGGRPLGGMPTFRPGGVAGPMRTARPGASPPGGAMPMRPTMPRILPGRGAGGPMQSWTGTKQGGGRMPSPMGQIQPWQGPPPDQMGAGPPQQMQPWGKQGGGQIPMDPGMMYAGGSAGFNESTGQYGGGQVDPQVQQAMLRMLMQRMQGMGGGQNLGTGGAGGPMMSAW